MSRNFTVLFRHHTVSAARERKPTIDQVENKNNKHSYHSLVLALLLSFSRKWPLSCLHLHLYLIHSPLLLSWGFMSWIILANPNLPGPKPSQC
ncbi:hypothetical protein PVAG01_05456 [Phlyctema vagabunda]|uniref:Uncharacterized protein n=1 Tax=Phlyctema vagabunda TaxID=108571 RepID=A0ABR4PK29_9HELO